jgi:dihydropyrimidinase
MNMIDLIIRGGVVVLPEGCCELDVAVDGGRIVALAVANGLPEARRTIDARGCYVLPGAIDPHVHINWPFLDATTADDYAGATVAAAMGGTTTIIDFAHPRIGTTPLERVANRRAQADGQAVIDFAFHCVLTEDSPQTLAEMGTLVAEGVTSFKLYMAYSRRGIMVDDATLLSIMGRVASLGAVVCVHAENGTVADANEARFLAVGRTAAVDFPQHKPNYIEAEAVSRAVFWARQAGARLYIVHLSTAEGLNVVRTAQREGVRVFAETCPQYLLLDDRVYARPEDGHRFICSPPIRSSADREALWKGITEGVVSVVATDHCAFTTSQKERGRGNFTSAPNGLPGVETRLPLLFSEGVGKGRISIDDLARITSLNPARVYGLYPRKGILRPGSDADVVLIDPTTNWTLSAKKLHMAVDWSPYEGLELQGAPVMTISRGEVIVEHGEFVGTVGQGQFVHRTPEAAT